LSIRASFLLVLAIHCGSFVDLRAQDLPADPQALRSAAAAAVDAELGGAAGACQAFLAQTRSAAALLLELRTRIEPGLRAFERAFPIHEKAFRKAAAATLAARRGRNGAARIDELRKKSLAISFGDELTKERIHTELDPILAELESLFVVGVADVHAHAPAVAAESTRLLDEAERLTRLFLLNERCEAALLTLPNGKAFLGAHKLAGDPRGFADRIAMMEATHASEATPILPRDAKTLSRNAATHAELDPEEVAGLRDLDRIRMRLGLPVLAVDTKLCAAGRGHSEDMATLGFFAHESPVDGKRTPSDRAALAGTSGGAENIAVGSTSGVGAIGQWWYSPGHHRNMLGGHGRVGLGRHGRHWTQMFGG
jgi:uncharacterized protein YkwD